MTKFQLFSIISSFIVTSAFTNANPLHEPLNKAKRFFPQDLQQDGKITLSPSFTPDSKTLYFSQSECYPIWECPQRLKTSTWNGSGWSKPVLVKLPSDNRVDWPNVSPDGKSLVFSWSAPRNEYQNLDIYENFDLYTLDLTVNDAVPIPVNGADINRPRAGEVKKRRFIHNESLPSITNNGDLYFMTERLDGTGERDIYIAPASKNGGYAIAHPLPEPINSKQRDDGVWVNPEGNLMLLSYPNRGGEGGADIFVSKKVKGKWQDPINVGSSVNTPFAEFGARLTPDGKKLLFTSDRPFGNQKAGLLQVWIVDFPMNVM